MQTGENEQALRKILDMTRLMAIAVLFLHFYYQLYAVFHFWDMVSPFTDRLLSNIVRTGLYSNFHKAKLIALGLLVVSLIGVRGRKNEKQTYKKASAYLLAGLLLYFLSSFILHVPADAQTRACLYMAFTSAGALVVLSGGTMLSRIIKDSLSNDIFNTENETFPQEERLLENDYSINLPARYRLKSKLRNSWINIINPFRGILVAGTPGAGKSYFIIRHIITQHIKKGFSMFVYDFKYPDLSTIVYNTWLQNKDKYKADSACYFINFDDLSRSHRCNPLDPVSMFDITDAVESARTILIGLNRSWHSKQGDFFVESAINFLTAIIWYLRKYQDGAYCTLPHVIELMQTDYETLFTILRTEKEVEVLINPFQQALLNNAAEQLEGQIGSTKIAIARLSSPQLYYVLSGNDFTLDINNPDSPKLLCAGSNPQKVETYGAVISLYTNRLIKLVNQRDKLPCSIVIDELPTVYLNAIDKLIATARSNKVSTTLALQDFSQLRKDYGKDYADVIMGIVGNIVSGQVTGDTAKQLSERIGKIMQDRQSLSINRQDTSISKSKQLEAAVPASKIAALSSGDFVGMVADDPDNRIELKAFHGILLNDHEAIRREERAYKAIPVLRAVDNNMVQYNYMRIKQEVEGIVYSELERIQNDPGLSHLNMTK